MFATDVRDRVPSTWQMDSAAAPGLIAAGSLWVMIFVVMIGVGLATGQTLSADSMSNLPLATQTYFALQHVSTVILDLGLLGLCARLHGRARRLGLSAATLAVMGVALGLTVLLLAPIDDPTRIDSPSGVVAAVANPLGAVATLLATSLLGLASVRTHCLHLAAGLTLVVVGIATMPILFATPLPIGPAWLTDTLAFVLSGFGYIAVGVSARARR